MCYLKAFRYKLYKTDKDATTLRAKPRKGKLEHKSCALYNVVWLYDRCNEVEFI